MENTFALISPRSLFSLESSIANEHSRNMLMSSCLQATNTMEEPLWSVKPKRLILFVDELCIKHIQCSFCWQHTASSLNPFPNPTQDFTNELEYREKRCTAVSPIYLWRQQTTYSRSILDLYFTSFSEAQLDIKLSSWCRLTSHRFFSS